MVESFGLRAAMSVKLLDASQVSDLLPKLFEKHDEIYVAAAWGSNGPVAASLFKQVSKFRSVTFGLAFCQTDPDLVDRMVGVANSFVALSDKGTFHPKLYYFTTDGEAEAIVGSSNFTNGGLGTNLEANLHIKGPRTASVFEQIRGAIQAFSKLQRPVTKELATVYRLQFNATKKLKKPKAPLLPRSGPQSKQLASKLVNMSWADYAASVRAGKFHNYSERLAVLRACQRMISSVSSFTDLSGNEWKAIAGVIGERQKRDSGLDHHDWAWFGSMKGMGDFANRISEKDRHLAAAMDGIPRHGDVAEDHYKSFCKEFLLGFQNSQRTGSYPTATRLLAMKRPDVFVCVSKPNLVGIADGLGFSKSTLTLENYWERVIEPIRVSPWFNASRPSGKDAELWDARVAMLDAIYYSPI
jgi:HKD family nuclease